MQFFAGKVRSPAYVEMTEWNALFSTVVFRLLRLLLPIKNAFSFLRCVTVAKWIIFSLFLIRCTKFLRPTHSSSGSRDPSKNDPTVCSRIYLKNQLSSGQPLRHPASLWPKPNEPILALRGPSLFQRRRLQTCTQPQPRPQQAPHGRPRCSSWPHR